MQVDVVIVGGGVIGVATAYGLCKARPGLKVLLLEAGSLGAVSGRLAHLQAVSRQRSYILSGLMFAAHTETPECTESCTALSTAQSCKQRH